MKTVRKKKAKKTQLFENDSDQVQFLQCHETEKKHETRKKNMKKERKEKKTKHEKTKRKAKEKRKK